MNFKNWLIVLALLIGSGLLALFFDARVLVWVLIGATFFFVVIFLIFAWREKFTKYPAVYYAALIFISWLWFSIVFGLRSLQIIPRGGAAAALLALAAAVTYFWCDNVKFQRQKQIIFFVLTAEGALLLLFAPVWFLVLGALVTVWNATLGVLLLMDETTTPRRIALTIIIGTAIVAFFVIGFKWRL